MKMVNYGHKQSASGLEQLPPIRAVTNACQCHNTNSNVISSTLTNNCVNVPQDQHWSIVVAAAMIINPSGILLETRCCRMVTFNGPLEIDEGPYGSGQ